jgi:hypothetical protein
MPRPPSRRRLGFEPLEGRLPLSGTTGLPANALGTGSGTIAAPHATATVTVTIPPESLAQGKASTLYAFKLVPTLGSGLAPTVVSATNAAGQSLPIFPGQPFSPNYHPWDQAYVADNLPGPLTVTISGRGRTTGSFGLLAYLPGDINGDHTVNASDLAAFEKSYNQHVGSPKYNPLADVNQNGYVGLDDGKDIERNISPLTPPGPLNVQLDLAPGEKILSPHSEHLAVTNSGGITRLQNVTVLGHTTPYSIVFIDSGTGDFRFVGAVTFADANGSFSASFFLKNQLSNTNYLVIDPGLQQTIRAFPIMRIVNRGQPESTGKGNGKSFITGTS